MRKEKDDFWGRMCALNITHSCISMALGLVGTSFSYAFSSLINTNSLYSYHPPALRGQLGYCVVREAIASLRNDSLNAPAHGIFHRWFGGSWPRTRTVYHFCSSTICAKALIGDFWYTLNASQTNSDYQATTQPRTLGSGCSKTAAKLRNSPCLIHVPLYSTINIPISSSRLPSGCY